MTREADTLTLVSVVSAVSEINALVREGERPGCENLLEVLVRMCCMGVLEQVSAPVRDVHI